MDAPPDPGRKTRAAGPGDREAGINAGRGGGAAAVVAGREHGCAMTGLWVQTAHDGWLRADQVVQVGYASSLGAPTEREVRVSVPVSGDNSKLASYAVAYCPSDHEAERVAFGMVQRLATQAHVAGIVRVRRHQVEVTPFGEFDQEELFH